MKMVWTALLVAGLVAVAGSAFAGAACCPAKGKEKASMTMCEKATAGLDLTAEQKAKIAEIQASCKADGCSADACAKYKSAIRDVLSDEQKAKFDAACEAKKAGGGCG